MPVSAPLVSVVIPTYNRSRLVLEAADSVLAQSYRPLELIVVDDGSTDATGAALAGRPEARTLRQAHSGMPGQVRNAGARLARGEFLAFLDSDDLWLPQKLALQVAAAAATGAVISHTRERWLRGGRVISQRAQRHRRRGDLFLDSLRKCVIGPSTVLLRRAAFEQAGGFREDLEIAEDYELWLRLTARYRVGYVMRELVIKRAGHADQLSERYGQIEIFRLRALHDLIAAGQFGAASPRHAAACAELARKARIYAAGCRKRGRLGEAQRYEALAQRWSIDHGKAGGPEAAADCLRAAVDCRALPRQRWTR